MLQEYEPPEIDPAVEEALQDFMARKKAAVPDSNV
jgi:trimethylamine--corrinoid protein Co-methyltransferase